MKITDVITEIGRPIAFYPSIARAFGSIDTALIVCQFMYWRGKVGNKEVYKTQSEIEAETCVPPHTQRRIFKRLEALGMVTVCKKGMPAKNYFKWHWDKVDEFISGNIIQTQQEVSTSANNLLEQDVTICKHKTQQKVSTTSETTTENTTKITTENIRRDKSRSKKSLDYSSWVLLNNNQPIDKLLLNDWLQLRKEKKASVSQTVINRYEKQFKILIEQYGFTLEQCLTEWVAKGWRGFEAQWLIRELNNEAWIDGVQQPTFRTNNKKLSAVERIRQNAEQQYPDLFER